MGEGGRLNRQIDGLLKRPLIRVLNDVLARRHLHHNSGDAAIERAFHVIHHAAGESENLRTELSLHDFLDRRFVAWRYHRHPGFNPVNSGFREPLGNPDLVVLREDDSGLLLPVPQSDIVKFDLLRKMKLPANCFIEVPGAHKPFIRFPRLT